MSARLNQRQLQMLHAIRERPCATLGPSDLIDQDYLALVREGFVHEYWGSGGTHCAMTEAGWKFLGYELRDEGNGSRWVKVP